MSTDLVRVEDAMNLALVNEPDKIVEQATKAATALMKIVVAKKLYQDIGTGREKRRHIKVEAWLMLAHFYGVTPRVVAVMPVQDETTGHPGFEATVEAVHVSSGRILGQAIARCMSNEENWGMVKKYQWENGVRGAEIESERRQKAMFQLESMAQTRATSKVLASLFRWVAILGGVDGTPAEELDGATNGKQKNEQGESGKRITQPQIRRMFAIGHSVGLEPDQVTPFFKRHGFDQSFEITADKYEAIVKEIESHKAGAASA